MPTEIIPEIIKEPIKAGCAPGNETIGYFAGEVSRLRSELKDAWGVINTLHMEAMDHREAWPRALVWLSRNAEFGPEKDQSHGQCAIDEAKEEI